MKIRNRIDIINYVKQHDPTCRVEDNVIFVPKAFIINTVIQWCYNQLETKKMNPEEMNFYLMAIQGFVEGKSNLSWDEQGNLVIS